MIHHRHRRYYRARFNPIAFGIIIFMFFIVGVPIGNVVTIVPLIFVGVIFFLAIYLSNRNSVGYHARTSDIPNNPYKDRYSTYSGYSRFTSQQSTGEPSQNSYEDRYSTYSGYSRYTSQQSTHEPSQNSYKSASSNPRYCVSCGNQLTGSVWSGNSQEMYSYCQYCGEKDVF